MIFGEILEGFWVSFRERTVEGEREVAGYVHGQLREVIKMRWSGL